VNPVIAEDCRALVAAMGATLDPLAGATLLVTGAGGFLCSWFLDFAVAYNEVAAEPCRVIAIDNFLSGLPERVAYHEGNPAIRLVKHDMREPFEPGERVDYILHGASVASPPFYRKYPLETIDVNVNGTRALLELARQDVKAMVYFSTSEIYGDPDPEHIPTREDYRGFVSCTGPRACYDESKRLAETLCWIYHQHHGVPIKVVRPFNVYGPGQRIDDGRIIPDLLKAALEGKPFVLHGDGRATRAFCYVPEAIRASLHVLLQGVPGEAYNVGNGHMEVSMAEVARAMAEVAAPPLQEVQYKPSADPHYLTDNPQRRRPDVGKLEALAGWSPEIGLHEGFSRTLRSYRA
jgi:dTDP-glucose 4,6-dehydratase/UDP-glucuronate decarboxylase